SYFALYNMPFTLLPAAYTTAQYGTRFPSYWFLPALIQFKPGKELEAYRDKYAAMAGEDFKKYKPAIVILAHLTFDIKDGKPFDFPGFFSRDPGFREAWKNYHKKETVTWDSRDYFDGYHFGSAPEPMEFDIYLRNDIKDE